MARAGEVAAQRSLVDSTSTIHQEVVMPKYVIEREIPGAGNMNREQLHGASCKSNGVLDELGPDIQWVQSYVTDDKIYCVYIAPSEQLILDHAERSGFPANSVSQVKAMIDPTMG